MISVLLDTYPEVEFLDRMIILFLSFLRNTFTVFNSAESFYVPINCVEEFHFLHTLTNICFLLIFLIIAILTGVRWCHIMVLICVSLMISVIEYLLIHCTIYCTWCLKLFFVSGDCFTFSLEKCIFRCFCLFFNQFICFFCYWIVRVS